MEEFNKENFQNMQYEQKNMFEKMMLSATLSMLRGIDMDLYSKTSSEMTNFIKDFQDFLIETKFSNKNLQVLNSLLIQSKEIIKDLKKEENNE